MPSILIENKIDLFPEAEMGDNGTLKEFADKNNFCGSFRSSAEKGINISESMEFLIKAIITGMETHASKGNEVFDKPRVSVVLDTQKHTDAPIKSKKKDKRCS